MKEKELLQECLKEMEAAKIEIAASYDLIMNPEAIPAGYTKADKEKAISGLKETIAKVEAHLKTTGFLAPQRHFMSHFEK